MMLRLTSGRLARWLLLAAPALALQPPAAQSEFVPVKLPPADQMPAAPLLVAAYAFIWLAVMFYLWTIWRRLGKVEAEMRALAAQKPQQPMTAGSLHLHPVGAADRHRDRVGARVARGAGRFRRGVEATEERAAAKAKVKVEVKS